MTRRDPKSKCHFRVPASQVPSSSAGPISISFLKPPCQGTQIKSHDQRNKAKKWKRIASLVLSSVQSSNFLLFCSSPPRLLFPKQSAISSAKGKRVAKISKHPCIQGMVLGLDGARRIQGAKATLNWGEGQKWGVF